METNLPLAHFRLHLRARTAIQFQNYSGSAWRGLLGHQLKKSVCVIRGGDCKPCALYARCPYSYLFETPPPAEARYMRRSTAAPHPFVLSPDPLLRSLEVGETTDLDLVLIGKAKDYLPYFVHVFQQAGERGVGVGKGLFELVAVKQAVEPGAGQWQSILSDQGLRSFDSSIPAIPSVPESVVMRFESPLRLKYQDRMLSPGNFSFAALIANLLRRYSMTSYFHNDTPVEMDFRHLIDQAEHVDPLHTRLRWFDWARYSSRQKKKIGMKGIVGAVEFSGHDIAPFWPLLWTGQWLHLGKGTSMGMGRYRLATPQACQS